MAEKSVPGLLELLYLCFCTDRQPETQAASHFQEETNRDQNIPQRPFYPAGSAGYITLELMRSYTIDCAQLRDESAFWEAYLAATKPEGDGYFGCNLDAFWDALNGGPGWPGECHLKFINTASLKALREGRFYQALQEIARDSELVEVRLE